MPRQPQPAISFKTEGLSFTCRFSATTTRSGHYLAGEPIADHVPQADQKRDLSFS